MAFTFTDGSLADQRLGYDLKAQRVEFSSIRWPERHWLTNERLFLCRRCGRLNNTTDKLQTGSFYYLFFNLLKFVCDLQSALSRRAHQSQSRSIFWLYCNPNPGGAFEGRSALYVTINVYSLSMKAQLFFFSCSVLIDACKCSTRGL